MASLSVDPSTDPPDRSGSVPDRPGDPGAALCRASHRRPNSPSSYLSAQQNPAYQPPSHPSPPIHFPLARPSSQFLSPSSTLSNSKNLEQQCKHSASRVPLVPSSDPLPPSSARAASLLLPTRLRRRPLALLRQPPAALSRFPTSRRSGRT